MEPKPLLKKVRANPAQSGLSMEKRRGNVSGVYAPVEKLILPGKRVLLNR